jgi:hypothetical protein
MMISITSQIITCLFCFWAGIKVGKNSPPAKEGSLKEWIKPSSREPKIIDPIVPKEAFKESEDITDFANKFK